MKTFLLIAAFTTFLETAYTQNSTKATYAIVYLEGNYDKPNKRYWCKINAESISKYSKEIRRLVNYSNEKGATNTEASFYFDKNDTTSVFFNFFLSATEAIQFLADNQWQLITVNTEINSDYDNAKDGEGKLIPVTKITSRPVYYFRKEIIE